MPNSNNFTVFQFSFGKRQDKITNELENYPLSAHLVKVVEGTIADKKFVPILELPKHWSEIIEFAENNVFAFFNARRTVNDIQNVLKGSEIDLSALNIIDLEYVIRHNKLVILLEDKKYLGYKDVADKFELVCPDIDNGDEKSNFTANLCLKLSDHLEIIPFEKLFESRHDSIYRREGSPDVAKIPFEELLQRPKENRFKGTYFAFTGTLEDAAHPKMLRNKAMEIVHQLGGMAADSKDKKVTHLVVGTQQKGRIQSSKEIEAEKTGKILVTATDFFELIESE